MGEGSRAETVVGSSEKRSSQGILHHLCKRVDRRPLNLKSIPNPKTSGDWKTEDVNKVYGDIEHCKGTGKAGRNKSGCICGRAQSAISSYRSSFWSSDWCVSWLQNKMRALIFQPITSLVVRFFWAATNTSVRSRFLKIIEVTKSDAITLTVYFFFEKCKIPSLVNIIGYASDTTNIMFGEHHSVVSTQKEKLPHLFVMKCLCHLAHLRCFTWLQENFSSYRRPGPRYLFPLFSLC